MGFADESENMALGRCPQVSTGFRGFSELVSSLPYSEAGGNFPIVSAESSNLVAPQFSECLCVRWVEACAWGSDARTLPMCAVRQEPCCLDRGV